MKQVTLESLALRHKDEVARRDRFTAEMQAVIPWSGPLARVSPRYPKARSGTRPMPLEPVRCIDWIQNRHDRSDPAAAEDAGYDSDSMRRFAGVESAEDTIPDETSLSFSAFARAGLPRGEDLPKCRRFRRRSERELRVHLAVSVDRLPKADVDDGRRDRSLCRRELGLSGFERGGVAVVLEAPARFDRQVSLPAGGANSQWRAAVMYVWIAARIAAARVCI